MRPSADGRYRPEADYREFTRRSQLPAPSQFGKNTEDDRVDYGEQQFAALVLTICWPNHPFSAPGNILNFCERHGAATYARTHLHCLHYTVAEVSTAAEALAVAPRLDNGIGLFPTMVHKHPKYPAQISATC